MAKSRRRTKTKSKTVFVTDTRGGGKKTPLQKPQTPRYSKTLHDAFRTAKTEPAYTPVRVRTPVQFCRRDTKSAMILDLLTRPHGATLSELIDATGWKPHSIRGFISGTVGKKLGFSVASAKDPDGARRYSIKV